MTTLVESSACGFIYVATGRRHLGEMLDSVDSLRRHMPGYPVVLYTDQQDLPSGVFDEVRELKEPKHSFMDKIAPLCESPFERTIFLDTDTRICASIADMFEVLDRFEIAVTHAPFRHDRPFVTPTCFAELNTGVIAYRSTETVIQLFNDWLETYRREVAETGKLDSDQPAFREAIYRSPAALYVLPSEYNLRTVMPAAVGRCTVRILHGRAPDMAAVETMVNASRRIRVFLPDAGHFHQAHFRVLSGPGKVVAHILHACVAPWIGVKELVTRWKRRMFR
jgi:hypothetical protein